MSVDGDHDEHVKDREALIARVRQVVATSPMGPTKRDYSNSDFRLDMRCLYLTNPYFKIGKMRR
jgi:hypothetical protein